MNLKWVPTTIGVLLQLTAGRVLADNNWMLTTATNASWKGIACSSDGMKLAAIVGGQSGAVGTIYTSSNAGASWTATTAPKQHWNGIASSTDGNKLAAVSTLVGGHLF